MTGTLIIITCLLVCAAIVVHYVNRPASRPAPEYEHEPSIEEQLNSIDWEEEARKMADDWDEIMKAQENNIDNIAVEEEPEPEPAIEKGMVEVQDMRITFSCFSHDVSNVVVTGTFSEPMEAADIIRSISPDLHCKIVTGFSMRSKAIGESDSDYLLSKAGREGSVYSHWTEKFGESRLIKRDDHYHAKVKMDNKPTEGDTKRVTVFIETELRTYTN